MTASTNNSATASTATAVALDDLDRHWGCSYDLAAWAGLWLARLDDGATLTAPTPHQLHDLLAASHAARPGHDHRRR